MDVVYGLAEKGLFDKYYKGMCYFAYTLIRDYSLAEDFVQDAFIAYFGKKEQIPSQESVVKSYLYTSVKNSILNWQRRNKVQEKYWEKTNFTEFDNVDIDNAIIETEVMEEINRIIKELPDACRTIFQLSYLEGLSNQEIADELNLSINTIKTQKRRGLNHVRSRLNPEYFLILISFFRF